MKTSTWPKGKSLLQILLEVDQAGVDAGEEPKARSLKNMIRLAAAVKPGGGTVLAGEGTSSYITKAVAIMRKLYRPCDNGIGALHVGAIMFRDMFFRINIPIIYGEYMLDPFESIDMTLDQQRWLKANRREHGTFIDQFLDLVDIGYGLDDLRSTALTVPDALSYISLSHMQLESAAATVTTQCDLRGAVQSSLLAVELVLKGAILLTNFPEKDLKDTFGHNRIKMINHLKSHSTGIDFSRVSKVVDILPMFVANRYAAKQPSRVETGHILMGSQFIAAEIIRSITTRNIRQQNGYADERIYP